VWLLLRRLSGVDNRQCRCASAAHGHAPGQCRTEPFSIASTQRRTSSIRPWFESFYWFRHHDDPTSASVTCTPKFLFDARGSERASH
jgi:hypothetical protein